MMCTPFQIHAQRKGAREGVSQVVRERVAVGRADVRRGSHEHRGRFLDGLAVLVFACVVLLSRTGTSPIVA